MLPWRKLDWMVSRFWFSLSLMADIFRLSRKYCVSGAVKTKEFELGKMLGNKKLGKVTFNLDVNSSHYEKQYPSVLLKGLVASIDYSDYNYENITLDGEKSVLTLFLSVQVSTHLKRKLLLISKQVLEKLLFLLQQETIFQQSFTMLTIQN